MREVAHQSLGPLSTVIPAKAGIHNHRE